MTGPEFHALYERLGYKQYEIARRLGVSLATVYRWTRAERVPTVVELAMTCLEWVAQKMPTITGIVIQGTGVNGERVADRIPGDGSGIRGIHEVKDSHWTKPHPGFERLKRQIKEQSEPLRELTIEMVED